ncbi:MAG: hypothetical protein LBU80_07620 [Rikenellaceae bacterium]|jgi:hypothetical protein|nr:hypothetical protein [Rikenellaceae bacterium]
MNLLLIKAISDFARERGIEFRSGFTNQMTLSKLAFPLIWLEPLVLTGKRGRKEVRSNYRVKLHLLELDRNFPQQEKDEVWNSLADRLVELHDTLGEHPQVIAIRNLECRPDQTRWTNYGELSVTASFEAETLFCRVG